MREDNFNFKMVSTNKVKKVVSKLNSKKFPRMVPSLQVFKNNFLEKLKQCEFIVYKKFDPP